MEKLPLILNLIMTSVCVVFFCIMIGKTVMEIRQIRKRHKLEMVRINEMYDQREKLFCDLQKSLFEGITEGLRGIDRPEGQSISDEHDHG